MEVFFVGIHQPDMGWPLTLRSVPVCISANVLIERAGDRIIPFAQGDDVPWLLDSGAFTQVSQHGRFLASPEDYAALIRRMHEWSKPIAAVTQDWMCEGPVLDKTGLTVQDHQRLTVERYDAIKAAGTGGTYLMPVLQGWTPKDYQRCVELYGDRLKPGAWVGVGSVCKRQGKPLDVIAILHAIREVRPDLHFHGFGVKTTSLRHPTVRELLTTADSMAWSSAARWAGRDQNSWVEAYQFWHRVTNGSAPQPKGSTARQTDLFC